MLAPVLARLSEVAGVLDVRVECSGTYFLVTVADAAAWEGASRRVHELLGARAVRVASSAQAAQLAARPRGEPWFSKDDVRALSYVEGRILTARFTDAVAGAVRLEPAVRDRVHEAIRAEVFAALEHAHDTGGRASSGWFWEAWPGVVDGIDVRLAELPEPLRTGIAGALRAAAPSAS